MIVLPRLLIKNPAIPSHRRVVPPLAANADLLKVRVSGALAWYLFSIVAASVSRTASDVRPRFTSPDARPYESPRAGIAEG